MQTEVRRAKASWCFSRLWERA